MDPSAIVSIGFTGNTPAPQRQHVGWCKHSWGLHSDDGHLFAGKGLPTLDLDGSCRYGRRGDVIGAGCIQGHVFFSHNGRLLRVWRMVPDDVTALFPSIAIERGEVRFRLNFGLDSSTPFVLAPTEAWRDWRQDPSQWRVKQRTRWQHLPAVLLRDVILPRALDSATRALALRRVSKQFSEAIMSSNVLWRQLSLRRWPLQNPNARIRSWQRFYRRRVEAITGHRPSRANNWSEAVPIENCVEPECPALLHELSEESGGSGAGRRDRLCGTCGTCVRVVTTETQVRAAVAADQRVALLDLAPPRMRTDVVAT